MTTAPPLIQGADGRMYVAPPPVVAPPLVYAPPGSYMPQPGNVGLLLNTPSPREIHVGDYTAAPNDHISDTEFTGRLRLDGAAKLSNVKAQAVTQATGAGAVAMNRRAGSIVEIDDSEICSMIPGGDHGYTAGLAYGWMIVQRTYVHNVIDCFDGFVPPPGADTDLATQFISCLFDQLIFTDDTFTGDHVAHNDIGQLQGSGGALFDGCNMRCVMSPSSPYGVALNPAMALKYGYTAAKRAEYGLDPKTGKYKVDPSKWAPAMGNGSVLAITPNVSKITRPVILRRGWGAGGRRMVGVVAGNGNHGCAPGMIQVHDMLFYDNNSGYGSTVDNDTPIITESLSWVEEGNNFYCDANGKSTGVACPPPRQGTPH